MSAPPRAIPSSPETPHKTIPLPRSKSVSEGSISEEAGEQDVVASVTEHRANTSEHRANTSEHYNGEQFLDDLNEAEEYYLAAEYPDEAHSPSSPVSNHHSELLKFLVTIDAKKTH